MTDYRFRAGEAGELVLQVFVRKQSSYDYGHGEWRDATVADIPVADPFRPAPPPAVQCGGAPIDVQDAFEGWLQERKA